MTVSSSAPVGRRVVVEVPATSANLGPGFDCFGLALDWREQVAMAVTESGFRVEVTGEGAGQIPRDESHLIIRSALTGLADLGVSVAGLHLSCHNTIPHGRGLGSSSAAIVAGLLAARGLAGAPEDRAWTLHLATAIEGHPDNVAAAIYGGFVLAYDSMAGLQVTGAHVAEGLALVAFVPDRELSTSAARLLLPRKVRHDDAAANAARSALFVHAVANDLTLLFEATRDWLHQGFRGPAMPDSYELLKDLRADGLAAVISGAGPTVLVLGGADEVGRATGRSPIGFSVRRVAVGSGAALVGRPALGGPR